MKIISKHTDYYDWVANRYGGGDPRLVYNRKNIETTSVRIFGNIPHEPAMRYVKDRSRWDKKWCCVCGKLYLLVSPEGKNEWTLIDKNSPVFLNLLILFWDKEEKEIDYYLGRKCEGVDVIAKRLKLPVFCIASIKGSIIPGSSAEQTVGIEPEVPCLRDLGFQRLIPAEQMYQEISMYLANVRSTERDLPPLGISNNERLRQRGFDKKTSFRGKSK
jgi:hypothetical protein